MSLQFTSDARPPSNVTLLPSSLIRPAFGELYGFDSDADTPSVPSFANTNSVDFDGTNDFMRVSAASAINFSGDMTVSAWVKLDTWRAAGIVGVGSSYPGMFHLETTSTKFIFYGSSGTLKSGLAPSASTWYNITVSVQSGTSSGTKMYINGSLNATGTHTITSTTAPLDIGKISYVNGYYFPGLIDEVALFNSALSASDASNIYNSGVPADLGSGGLNLSPVGWWRMGENDGATGTTITDQGSGGNDGTLTNGPTFSTDVPS